MAGAYKLPSLPVKHADFLGYINSHPQDAVVDLVRPYNEYDSVVRKIYAQQPSHPVITNNLLNVVPLFDAGGLTDLRVRARDLASEPEEVKARFLMPLRDEVRKPNGAPAAVSSFKEFQTNFNLFSESSLSDLDWSNVVAAGSAVTSSLLPVPAEYRDSKRGLRQFYHEKFAPASDVDLFLYGLTEEQAIEKIQQIETKIKDSILSETTTIRTKNTITIVSQYPTRHVQIVLRMYKSIAEILTGFDVDCSCAAYDGHQVYIAPRAVGAFITQINHVDLTRRSPSYENRLSKYSHRGFEVFWPQLDRSRIDPTIFERSFTRTVGLARLLVLEKLPKSSDRDAYLDRRRRERGRPSLNRFRFTRKLHGNIKNDWDDEIAEWVEEEEVSDYHTFTIPYGEKFHARKIEKLIYTKDLLLNAEWNKPKDREVDLHRHPAFFGNVEDVIHDCCGSCPIPVTPEEKEIAEEESKIYVSGKISFLKDNPGRQEIGSFNPITETDWTEMAYVGNTAGLCQAIVDEDIESVTECLSQGLDVNRRDYTGRTPLHLATMTSTPTIVQCLVDHGARLIARLADGRTALHLAAARGNVEIIKILLTKSGENEEEENRKEISRKEAMVVEEKEDQKSDEVDDPELLDDDSDESDADDRSYATGSFVKVKKDGKDDNKDDNILDDTNDLDPDVYDINVLAWDNHSSPLHLAILNGHTAAVEELVSSFGANVLLPIKLINEYNNSPRAAILTLVLALQLPIGQAKLMTSKLLQLGASPAQADVAKKTALHYVAAASIHHELLDAYLQHDQPAVQRTINYLSMSGHLYDPGVESALITAIQARNVIGAIKLLEAGANPTIQFEEYIKSAKDAVLFMRNHSSDQNEKLFHESVAQPVMLAVQKEQPSIALALLARGADPNTLDPAGHKIKNDINHWRGTTGRSLLDCVQEKLKSLREYQGMKSDSQRPRTLDPDDHAYLGEFQDDTYRMWAAKASLAAERKQNQEQHALYEDQLKTAIDRKGLKEKEAAIQALVRGFEELEEKLLAKQAKTFKEMCPDIELPPAEKNNNINIYTIYTSKPEGPFKITFDFKRPDLTDVMKEGYLQLLEAAWCGDLDTIKSLTLGMWGPEKQHSPLEIGVTDLRSFSSFAIAVMRGHLNTAKAILAIALAQYRPQDGSGHVRYTIRTSDEDDEYNSENGDSDENNIQVKSYVIDDQFTIENVGEIKTKVESRISPLILLNGQCAIQEFLGVEDKRFHQSPVNLLQYAIWKDDADLLVFLLDLGQELTAKLPSNSDSPVYTTSSNEFDMALRLGRLRCLTELIKRTGAGLPLDELADQSGVEVKENPKFYQGLSIHGQKRADWAAAARGTPVMQAKGTHPPLLLAARQGNLDAVEWFLGTAPGRHYTEFTQAHKQDKRLMRLALAEGGIDRAMTDWLGSRRHLVLHCAIISHPTDESERLVKYLVQNIPHCLEVNSVGGYTPLSLAFALHHFRFAKILIEAGADQTVRDKKGNNLLHLLLRSVFHPSKDRLNNLQNMLGLIDPLLVPSMLTERSSSDPGSLTPIAQWMVGAFSTGQSYRFHGSNQTVNWEDKLKVLCIVLDFAEHTGQKHLELLDGAGNTVFHDAVRCQLPQVLQILLERRPDLLYRENTSGFTPAELAEASWVASATADPPILAPPPSHYFYSHHQNQDDIIHKQPEHFVQDNTEEGSAQRNVYDMCRAETPNRVSKKRRLVTLFEANEVTKRLATKEMMGVKHVLHRSGRRRRGRRGRRGEWSTESDEEVTDEVRAWAGYALPPM